MKKCYARHFLQDVRYLKLKNVHYIIYITFKENIAVVEPTCVTKDFPNPEFTILLFHSKLLYAPPKIFLFSVLSLQKRGEIMCSSFVTTIS